MKRYLVAATFTLTMGFGASQALAATILPDPTSTYDGIPVAIQYDDFYSYSAALLTEFGFEGFDYSSGTGTLDLILMTGAGGASNLNTGAGGVFNFEDPMPSSGGGTSAFAGTWGAGVQDNGPVTVDNLYNYLIATYGPTASVPVFTFDMNQTGNNQDLSVVGKVSIVDPNNGGAVIDAWYFDDIDNGVFDQDAWVFAPGNTVVAGTSGTIYDVDNNLGSGSTSFIVYAPTMNLANYLNLGYLFVGDFWLMDLNNGFEELFLTGAFAPFDPENPPDPIPEPGTLLLLGGGLMGLGFYMRRRKQ